MPRLARDPEMAWPPPRRPDPFFGTFPRYKGLEPEVQVTLLHDTANGALPEFGSHGKNIGGRLTETVVLLLPPGQLLLLPGGRALRAPAPQLLRIDIDERELLAVDAFQRTERRSGQCATGRFPCRMRQGRPVKSELRAPTGAGNRPVGRPTQPQDSRDGMTGHLNHHPQAYG
jgi:hypothetical protein